MDGDGESRTKFYSPQRIVYMDYIDVMYINHYMQIYTVREIDILYAELPTRTNKHSTNIV